MAVVGSTLWWILQIIVLVVIARIIIDWVQVLARNWRPTGVIAVLCEVVYSVTDPMLRALRSLIPPIRLGAVMLDLSPMILLIILFIAQAVVQAVFW